MKATTFALLLSSLVAAPASAQELLLTAEVGLGAATLSGDMIDADHVTALTAGLGLELPISTDVSFATGLHWLRKGASGTVVGFEEPLAVDVRLDYLQIPLLARVGLPGTRSIRPHVAAGVAVGFEVGCDVRTANSELALTFGCDDPGADRDRVDWSALVGGGVTWHTDRARLLLEGRWDAGLTEVGAAAADLHNRALLVTAGVAWPIGGGS